MDKERKDSLKKQEEDFNAMTEFVESQLNHNGNTEDDLASDTILCMMDILQKYSENKIKALEANQDDDDDIVIDLNKEKQQWDNINKVLSNADKIRKSLKNEIKGFR